MTNEDNQFVLNSELSQASSVVMIGVGSQRAPRRCLVSNNLVAGQAKRIHVEQPCIKRLVERSQFDISGVRATDSTGSSEDTAVFLDADGTGWICRADGAGNITDVEFQD